MKIGMIFECGPQGADLKVCKHLAQHLRPDLSISAVTLDNKKNLMEEAGRNARLLLADGCRAVLIVWDLRPAWPEKKGKPCRHADKDAILSGLHAAGVANQAVHLICIEQELESWLLANERAISTRLTRPAHQYEAPRVRKPDAVRNPKAVMNNHFTQARGEKYNDIVHAMQVIMSVAIDLSRMRRSASFARFERKLLSC